MDRGRIFKNSLTDFYNKITKQKQNLVEFNGEIDNNTYPKDLNKFNEKMNINV
jgi:hypothetical protein